MTYMSRKNLLILGTVIVALVIAVVCLTAYVVSLPDRGADQVQTVDRNGSVETSVSVQHADSTHDVILTTHKVWVRASQYASLVHRDTIPALDSTSVETETASGDTRWVMVKKDYQLFITVK
jgi:hypothetical protein